MSLGFVRALVIGLHHFHESLNRRKAGEAVEITVWREGETLALRPVLGEEQ